MKHVHQNKTTMSRRRLLLYLPFVLILFLGCHSTKKISDTREWQSLFNGGNLDGWIPKIYHFETGDNYAHTFRVSDSTILVSYDEYTEFKQRYGHLFYKTPFSSYHLKFEYRLPMSG